MSNIMRVGIKICRRSLFLPLHLRIYLSETKPPCARYG